MGKTLLNRLIKIKALADYGSAGERTSARLMLNRLLAENDIDETALIKASRKTYKFSYANQYERQLLFQVYCKVLRVNDIRYHKNPDPKKRSKSLFFLLTVKQYLEIKRQYEAYRIEFKKDLDRVSDSLISAYVSKHNLWSGVRGDDDSKINKKDFELIIALIRDLKEVKLDIAMIENK